MTYTKGKWVAIEAVEGAETHGYTYTRTTTTNANLIASSPELLKALNGILDYFSEYEDDYSEKLECFENARTAIAKAEGGRGIR